MFAKTAKGVYADGTKPLPHIATLAKVEEGLPTTKTLIMIDLKTLLIIIAFASTINADAQFVSTSAPNLHTTDIGMNDYVLSKGLNNLNRIGHLASGTWGNTNDKWSAIGVPNIGTGINGVQIQGTNMYGYLVNWDSDRFFCGLQDDGTMQKNAIIGWGDNYENTDIGYDKLLFKWFPTTWPSNSNTSGEDVMVMFPSKNVGIGSAFTDANQPWRRLDVFHATTPQFRLTQTQNSNSSLGRYTDFQTTALGDLFIDPHDGANLRRVGISISAPNRKLDVFDQSGNPQLRLTYYNGGPFQYYTDLQTTSNGHFHIDPRIGPSSTNVGISVATPTERLDVNGGLRIRSVPTALPNAIITGVTQGSAGDLVARRLDFPNDPAVTLLGNGTWGNPIGGLTANNGLIINPTGNIQLGQTTCASSGTGQLVRNTYIPLNNYNLVFSDGGASQLFSSNRIGVGTCSPLAKVDIVRPQIGPNEVSPIALRVQNSDVGSPTIGSASVNGSEFICNGTNRVNRGIYTYATNSEENVGIKAEGYPATGTSWSSIGVEGVAKNGGSNRGVYGWAGSSIGVESQNTGVAGYAGGASFTNIGISGTVANGPGGQPNNCAGYFNGDVFTTSASYYVSDLRLKKDTRIYEGALSALEKLKVYDYEYSSPYGGINLPEGRQIGLFAQDIETVFPSLIKGKSLLSYDTSVTHPIQIKAVNYTGLIPITLQAVKELNHKTDKLEKLEIEVSELKIKYKELHNLLHDICNNGCNSTTELQQFEKTNSAKLYQNTPNPFANATDIKFFIPESSKSVFLTISDYQGQVLKHFRISERGSSNLTLSLQDIGAGTYFYSLFIDGNHIDTKSMTYQK